MITQSLTPANPRVKVSLINNHLFSRSGCIVCYGGWTDRELHVSFGSLLFRYKFYRARRIVDPSDDDIGKLDTHVVLDIIRAHEVRTVKVQRVLRDVGISLDLFRLLKTA